MSSSGPRRIGIITGSGPEAGLDLWQKVLEENRLAHGLDFRGDIDAPDVTVLSIPELGYSMDLPETTSRVWTALADACERIAPQVDVFAIACNTLYAFEEDVLALELSATLVSPVDSVAAAAKERGLSSIALLGAGPVTNFDSGTSPYARLSSELEVELPADRQALHELIEQVKLAGGSTPEIEERFATVTNDLSGGVAALACTELPLIDASPSGVELLDVTRLLARDLLKS